MHAQHIAIIGYGKIAEDQHVPSIEGNGRFELVATSSRSGQGVGQKFTSTRERLLIETWSRPPMRLVPPAPPPTAPGRLKPSIVTGT